MYKQRSEDNANVLNFVYKKLTDYHNKIHLFIFKQLEGGGVASGGLRELIPCIARTAVAVGVDGIFMEV